MSKTKSSQKLHGGITRHNLKKSAQQKAFNIARDRSVRAYNKYGDESPQFEKRYAKTQEAFSKLSGDLKPRDNHEMNGRLTDMAKLGVRSLATKGLRKVAGDTYDKYGGYDPRTERRMGRLHNSFKKEEALRERLGAKSLIEGKDNSKYAIYGRKTQPSYHKRSQNKDRITYLENSVRRMF